MRAWEFMRPPLVADSGDVQGIDKRRGGITIDPQRHGGEGNIRGRRQAVSAEVTPRKKTDGQPITR
jgi:hypothetical protein